MVKPEQALSQAWGRPVPDSAGASLPQMIEAARKGQLKALYIVGKIPSAPCPHPQEFKRLWRSWNFWSVRNCF
jgi:predicted molibdopterin-dependent oxidoreductase YjgC